MLFCGLQRGRGGGCAGRKAFLLRQFIFQTPDFLAHCLAFTSSSSRPSCLSRPSSPSSRSSASRAATAHMPSVNQPHFTSTPVQQNPK
eukprot:2187866-Rhodomonas_salina.1